MVFISSYTLCCFALCAAAFSAALALPHQIRPRSTQLPPVSLCKPGGSAPAFFCTDGGAVFVPRGANYIRLWPEDAPTYHRWRRFHTQLSSASTVAPVTHATAHSLLYTTRKTKRKLQVANPLPLALPSTVYIGTCLDDDNGDDLSLNITSAVTALSGAGYNVVRVFIDHGDGTRTDSVGGYSPGDASVALGKECASSPQFASSLSHAGGRYMDTFASFVSLANAHGIYVAPTLETPEGCPVNAFFQRMFPSRSYPAPNTQYLDADGQAAKAWYAAAFMNETVTRLGASSGIFALLLENEAYYQNDMLPFSSTAPAPQWPTAAGV